MILKELVGRFSKSRAPEKHSGVPLAAHPAGTERPLSIEELIQKYIREEVSARAAEEGDGSFEEEDDFEVEDEEDVLPLTHHQVVAMSEDELRDEASAYGIELTRDSHAGSPGGSEATAVGSPGVSGQDSANQGDTKVVPPPSKSAPGAS